MMMGNANRVVLWLFAWTLFVLQDLPDLGIGDLVVYYSPPFYLLSRLLLVYLSHHTFQNILILLFYFALFH